MKRENGEVIAERDAATDKNVFFEEQDEGWTEMCAKKDGELAQLERENDEVIAERDSAEKTLREEKERYRETCEVLADTNASLGATEGELMATKAELVEKQDKIDEQEAEIARLEEHLRLEQVTHKWDETRDKANLWDVYKRLSCAIFWLERFERNRTQMPQQDINDIVKDAHEMLKLRLDT